MIQAQESKMLLDNGISSLIQKIGKILTNNRLPNYNQWIAIE